MFLIDATSSCMIEAKYCKNPPLGHRINTFYQYTIYTMSVESKSHNLTCYFPLEQ